MMNFIEIAKKRYSVRNYSSKKVEKEKLDPTAGIKIPAFFR